MDQMKLLRDGLRELGHNPRADRVASFADACFPLANLRETAKGDSAEAKEAREDLSKFVAMLDENELWKYLAEIRQQPESENSGEQHR